MDKVSCPFQTGWMGGCVPQKDVLFVAKFFCALRSDATVIKPPELLDGIKQ
jgi:hypothetical protein